MYQLILHMCFDLKYRSETLNLLPGDSIYLILDPTTQLWISYLGGYWCSRQVLRHSEVLVSLGLPLTPILSYKMHAISRICKNAPITKWIIQSIHVLDFRIFIILERFNFWNFAERAHFNQNSIFSNLDPFFICLILRFCRK